MTKPNDTSSITNNLTKVIHKIAGRIIDTLENSEEINNYDEGTKSAACRIAAELYTQEITRKTMAASLYQILNKK